MTYRLGVDTGGTFTDVIVYDETQDVVTTTKTPSTPPRFDTGVLEGVEKIFERLDISTEDVTFFSHGTTVGTNAVLESDLPDIGLITNTGLRDVLEIGDQRRPELYNLQTEKPPHLVPRYLRREVPGRIDASGDVVDPLDETVVRQVVSDLAAEGVDAVVVSMLFSYLNPAHERRVGELIEAADADVDYALSSAVHPEIREYDRTITTVLNEGIKGTISAYLDRLETGIDDRGIDAPLNVMHSGGGIFSAAQATERAIRTVLSGPAAGAVATKDVASAEGYTDAIGMDMGGTSADVSLVRDGELIRSMEGDINDLPVKTPMIDINTVGAGGGSIAWIDDGGALRVGPRSAGADPGPICYDRGGEDPTLTDANLLLGRLSEDAFLDGEMALAVERTRERFEAAIAEPLDRSVPEAAQSVIEVATASLVREIRRVTVERGLDPDTFALVAFGGAGPLHAPFVAAELDVDTVVVPSNPGVFSARGLLIANVRVDESHAYREDDLDPVALREQFDRLEADLLERLRAQGFVPEETTIDRSVDMRYDGQAYELTVPIGDGRIDGDAVSASIEAFHDKHARRYGHAMREEPTEVVTLRVDGTVPTDPLADEPAGGAGDARRTERPVYFVDGGFRDTPIYHRNSLAAGQSIEGPAVLEESGSTSLVPPGWTATVSSGGSVIVERKR
jgi:N-methylhydantoinase A